MLRAVPKSWFSSTHRMSENDSVIATVDLSGWREAGELTIMGSLIPEGTLKRKALADLHEEIPLPVGILCLAGNDSLEAFGLGIFGLRSDGGCRGKRSDLISDFRSQISEMDL